MTEFIPIPGTSLREHLVAKPIYPALQNPSKKCSSLLHSFRSKKILLLSSGRKFLRILFRKGSGNGWPPDIFLPFLFWRDHECALEVSSLFTSIPRILVFKSIEYLVVPLLWFNVFWILSKLCLQNPRESWFSIYVFFPMWRRNFIMCIQPQTYYYRHFRCRHGLLVLYNRLIYN